MKIVKYYRRGLPEEHYKKLTKYVKNATTSEILIYADDENCKSTAVEQRVLTAGITADFDKTGMKVFLYDIFQLGFSLREWLAVLEIFYRRQGLFIYFVKEEINVGSPFINPEFFNLLLESDSELRSRAAQKGIAKGGRRGRPSGVFSSPLDSRRTEIEQYLKNGATQTWIAKKIGVKNSNLSQWIKRRKVKEGLKL